MSLNCRIRNEITNRDTLFLNNILVSELALYFKIQSALQKFHDWDKDTFDKMFGDQKKIIRQVIKDISGEIYKPANSSINLQNEINSQNETEQAFGFYYWDDIIKILLRENEAIISVLKKYIQLAKDKFKNQSIRKSLYRIIERHEELAWMLSSYLSFKILCVRKLEAGTNKTSDNTNHLNYE